MENYKICQNIGEGAHGIVYRAKRRKDGKLCALKKVSLKKIDNQGFPVQVLREIKVSEYISKFTTQQGKFDLPAEKVKNTLQAKRNRTKPPVESRKSSTQNVADLFLLPANNFIIYLHEAFSHGTAFILSFDYMISDLSEIIRSHPKKLSLPEIKCYVIQITRGIEFIHSCQFIHRDLKPANILLSDKNIVKIADFGQARIYSDEQQNKFYRKYKNPGSDRDKNLKLLQYSHQVATRWYRSPELLYGAKEYDRGIDIWALGAIFSELFTRGPIFRGETDIEQIISVIQILGPTKYNWPENVNLPDYTKIEFPEVQGEGLKSILPNSICPDDCHFLKLIENLLIYSSSQRFTASQILQSDFILSLPLACHFSELPRVNKFENRLLQKEFNSLNLNDEELIHRDLETVDLDLVEDFDEAYR